MVTTEDIQNRVKAQPFVPFRIVTSEGAILDVHRPDMVMIGRRDMTIGTPSKRNPAFYEHATRIAYTHISALQDVPVDPPSHGL